MSRPGRVRVATVLVVLAGPGACAPGSPGPALPPSPPVVEVVMRDFAYELTPPRVSGRVVFRVRNEGTVDHQVTVFPLPDDLPPLDEQLRGSQRRMIDSVAEVPLRRPGQSDLLAMDLVPGQRYGFVCFQRDGEGRIYGLRGMSREFRAPAQVGF